MYSRQRHNQDVGHWYEANHWTRDDYGYDYEVLPTSWTNVNVSDSFRPLDFRDTAYVVNKPQQPINNNLADVVWDDSDWHTSPWSAPKKNSNSDWLKRRTDCYWSVECGPVKSHDATEYFESDQQIWRTGAYREVDAFNRLPKWTEEYNEKTWKFLNSFDPVKTVVPPENNLQRSPSPENSGPLLESRTDTTDVNMVSRSFNNFTVSTDKKADILKMVRERRRTKYSNIWETQHKSEAKILNNGKNLHRSTPINRRQRLTRSSLSSYVGQPDIADGLVLEKVRYDPNWKKHNKVLCSSEDSFKSFCNNVPINKPPKSAPLESTTDEPWSHRVVQHQQVDNPSVPESPIDNITPTVDANRNTEKPKTLDDVKDANHVTTTKTFGDFNISDIETTLPTIDWEAMEAHLARSAAEDDWFGRRRYDREEIRRRLALETEFDDFEDDYPFPRCGERGKKPSLTTRLQNSMNMQICFMNETTSDSDNEDQSAEDNTSNVETTRLLPEVTSSNSSAPSNKTDQPTPNAPIENNLSEGKTKRPNFFFAKQRSWRLRSRHKHEVAKEKNVAKNNVEDFYTRQAKLQSEARLALVQAKEMARMQMEIERQTKKKSPISDIVGLTFTDGKDFSLTRSVLNSMNIAQLQVIVNDFHTQIESLNDELVEILLRRDDLHMEQDSMLVDIEDLTRYLGAKNTNLLSLQKNKLNSK